MATIKFDAIPSDAIINLKLSGAFYEKLKIVLLSLTEKVPADKLLPMLEKFKTPQAHDDSLEFGIYNLLLLINTIEIEAKKQGLTAVQEMEAPE